MPKCAMTDMKAVMTNTYTQMQFKLCTLSGEGTVRQLENQMHEQFNQVSWIASYKQYVHYRGRKKCLMMCMQNKCIEML